MYWINDFIFQEHRGTLETLGQIYEYTLDITDNMSDTNANKDEWYFQGSFPLVYTVRCGCGPQSCFWMRKWEK